MEFPQNTYIIIIIVKVLLHYKVYSIYILKSGYSITTRVSNKNNEI